MTWFKKYGVIAWMVASAVLLGYAVAYAQNDPYEIMAYGLAGPEGYLGDIRYVHGASGDDNGGAGCGLSWDTGLPAGIKPCATIDEGIDQAGTDGIVIVLNYSNGTAETSTISADVALICPDKQCVFNVVNGSANDGFLINQGAKFYVYGMRFFVDDDDKSAIVFDPDPGGDGGLAKLIGCTFEKASNAGQSNGIIISQNGVGFSLEIEDFIANVGGKDYFIKIGGSITAGWFQMSDGWIWNYDDYAVSSSSNHEMFFRDVVFDAAGSGDSYAITSTDGRNVILQGDVSIREGPLGINAGSWSCPIVGSHILAPKWSTHDPISLTWWDTGPAGQWGKTTGGSADGTSVIIGGLAPGFQVFGDDEFVGSTIVVEPMIYQGPPPPVPLGLAAASRTISDFNAATGEVTFDRPILDNTDTAIDFSTYTGLMWTIHGGRAYNPPRVYNEVTDPGYGLETIYALAESIDLDCLNAPDQVVFTAYVAQNDIWLQGSKVYFRHKADSVLADVTSVVFGDSGDTYGVKEKISGTVRIAAGATALTKESTGVYFHDIGEETWYDQTIAYLYALKVVDGDITTYFDDNEIPGVTEPSPATLCTVYGYIKDLQGAAVANATIKATLNKPPKWLSGSAIEARVVTATSNALGYFELPLLKGAEVRLECRTIRYKKTVTVPTTDTADWETL